MNKVKLWFVDRANNRVVALNTNGNVVDVINRAGFDQPYDVAVGPNEQKYVVSGLSATFGLPLVNPTSGPFSNQSIFVYGKNGHLLSTQTTLLYVEQGSNCPNIIQQIRVDATGKEYAIQGFASSPCSESISNDSDQNLYNGDEHRQIVGYAVSPKGDIAYSTNVNDPSVTVPPYTKVVIDAQTVAGFSGNNFILPLAYTPNSDRIAFATGSEIDIYATKYPFKYGSPLIRYPTSSTVFRGGYDKSRNLYARTGNGVLVYQQGAPLNQTPYTIPVDPSLVGLAVEDDS